MLYKLKNISGGDLIINNITLLDTEELIFYDDSNDDINGVEDILVSINSISNNINEYFFNSDIQYIEDNTTKTNQEFYSFWNTFSNIIYPDLLNIISISRKAIGEEINGMQYDSISGNLSLENDRTIITNDDVVLLNDTYSWGDHSTSGYISGSDGVKSGFISVYNTNTTTNINVDSPGIRVPITGIAKEISSDFQINGDGIRVLKGGLLLFTASIYFTSTTQRPNLDLSFEIENTVQNPKFAHGYIRAQSGHNESSITMIQWLRVSDGETVYIRSERISNTGTVTMPNNNSMMEIYKPIDVAAKGDRGDDGSMGVDGQSAFNFLDGVVPPDSNDGIIGDIYIDTITNDFYRKDSSTTWSYLTTLQSGFSENQSIIPIWAEEASGLSGNSAQWSFGNGAIGLIGITIPFDAKVIAMSFQAEVPGGINSLVNLVVNDFDTGVGVTKIANQKTAYVNFVNNPYDIVEGDVIGFKSIISGGATDVRVCAWLLLDNNDILGSGGSSSPDDDKSMILSFGSDTSFEVNASSTSYTKVATFIYAGSSVIGAISGFIINVWKIGGSSVNIRIYDATNAQIISELNNITATSELNFQQMGIVTNVPTSISIFEVQIQINGGGTTGYCGSIEIRH